jgi:hypothetical protein
MTKKLNFENVEALKKKYGTFFHEGKELFLLDKPERNEYFGCDFVKFKWLAHAIDKGYNLYILRFTEKNENGKSFKTSCFINDYEVLDLDMIFNP